MATTRTPQKTTAPKPTAKTVAKTVAKTAAARKSAPKKATTAEPAAAAAPAPAAPPAAPAKKAATKKAAAPAKTPVAAKKAEKTAPIETPPAARKTAAKTAAAKQAPVKTEPVATAPVAPAPAKKAPAAKKTAAAKAPAAKAPTAKAPAAKSPTRKSSTRKTPDAATVTEAAAAVDVPAPAAEVSPAPAPAPAPTPAPAPEPRRKPARKKPARAQPAAAVAEDSPAPAPAVPDDRPPYSAIEVVGDEHHRIVWRPGRDCPPALAAAAAERLDADGALAADDDAALPLLLRLAADHHHRLQVADAVWAQLAADRDARHRLHALESAYPDGPASAGLQGLLRLPLPLFQAEGALFAVIAGRALIADERGLGKTVQAIAAAELWRRHFGVQRVLVLCAPVQRAAWQRAWRRFAGSEAQVMDGGLHQRQALWSADAAVRILAPEALASDAAHVAHWAPELVIVDEPQRLEGWSALAAPHALVLCGAPLADEPALLESLVDWLDPLRQGPLAALRRIHAARAAGQALDEAEVQQLSDRLSRVLLQRERSEVAAQLPPRIFGERLLPLAPAQRDAHDRLLAQLKRGLAGWQASGWLSDAEQWRLGAALRDLRQACHRADPGDADSALADATLQALLGQVDDWSEAGAQRIAIVCDRASDREQIAQRLAVGAAAGGAVDLVLADEPLPPGTEVVLQVGVPWRPPRPGRDDAPRGQQWQCLVAQDSLEAGLYDTLAWRHDVPRGPADGDGRAYLHGERLAAWLLALQAALQAMPAGR